MASKESVFSILGASNHSKVSRETFDYYATPIACVEDLLKAETFSKDIWEPCCGGGHICEVLKKNNYNVVASDLIDRGYPGTIIKDFFSTGLFDNSIPPLTYDIITNPPYGKSTEFLKVALTKLSAGHKLALFLKLTFLEGQERYQIFKENPPKTIYVYSKRVACGKNGDFYDRDSAGNIKYNKDGTPIYIGSAVCYAWFIWEKGFKGDPIIKWL